MGQPLSPYIAKAQAEKARLAKQRDVEQLSKEIASQLLPLFQGIAGGLKFNARTLSKALQEQTLNVKDTDRDELIAYLSNLNSKLDTLAADKVTRLAKDTDIKVSNQLKPEDLALAISKVLPKQERPVVNLQGTSPDEVIAIVKSITDNLPKIPDEVNVTQKRRRPEDYIVVRLADGRNWLDLDKLQSGGGGTVIASPKSFVPTDHDYIGMEYPNATTEVFTYKRGGASGSTLAVVTIVYTDSTKENISSVSKT